MKEGTLTTTATNFNFDKKEGNLTLGANTTHLGGIENITTTNNSNLKTTKASLNLHHTAVDAVSAAEKVKKTAKAVKQAKEALDEAHNKYAKGEISKNALNDYKTNLAGASLNLANAQINLGKAAKNAAVSGLKGGFSNSSSSGQWQGTNINGANTTFIGDKVTGQGLTLNSHTLTQNINDLSLTASTNTHSGSGNSNTKGITGSISSSGNNVNLALGASTQKSQYNNQSTTYTNSQISVDNIKGNLNNLKLHGSIIKAKTGSLQVKNLDIKTVQNTSNSSNSSKGGNININLGESIGGSIGVNKGKGSSNSSLSAEQSGIIFTTDDHSLTAGNTINKGGIITNIKTDAQGNKTNGKLNFITDTLTTENITNTKTAHSRNIGGSVGISTDGVNASVQLGSSGQDYQSETLATIGKGAVVTSDAVTGKNSLAGVNTDALNTENIIKNVQTGALDVDSNLDTRVFTKTGRKQIVEEQKNLTTNIKKTTAVIGTGVMAVPVVIKATTDDGNANDQTHTSTIEKVKNEVIKLDNGLDVQLNNPELAAKMKAIANGDITNKVEIQNILTKYNKAIMAGTSQATKIHLADIPDTQDGKTVLGTANETNGKDIFINQSKLDSSLEVTHHENAHLNDQGESTATFIGKANATVAKLGNWANNKAVNEASKQLQDNPVTVVKGVNDAQAQKELIETKSALLKQQTENGDVFENHTYYKSVGKHGETKFSQFPPTTPPFEKVDTDAGEVTVATQNERVLNDQSVDKLLYFGAIKIEDLPEAVDKGFISKEKYNEILTNLKIEHQNRKRELSEHLASIKNQQPNTPEAELTWTGAVNKTVINTLKSTIDSAIALGQDPVAVILDAFNIHNYEMTDEKYTYISSQVQAIANGDKQAITNAGGAVIMFGITRGKSSDNKAGFQIHKDDNTGILTNADGKQVGFVESAKTPDVGIINRNGLTTKQSNDFRERIDNASDYETKMDIRWERYNKMKDNQGKLVNLSKSEWRAKAEALNQRHRAGQQAAKNARVAISEKYGVTFRNNDVKPNDIENSMMRIDNPDGTSHTRPDAVTENHVMINEHKHFMSDTKQANQVVYMSEQIQNHLRAVTGSEHPTKKLVTSISGGQTKNGMPTARPSSRFNDEVANGNIDVVFVKDGKVTHEWGPSTSGKEFGWIAAE